MDRSSSRNGIPAAPGRTGRSLNSSEPAEGGPLPSNPLIRISAIVRSSLDIRPFIPFIRPYLAWFAGGFLVMTIGSLVGLCFPLLVGGLVDAALHPGGTKLPGFGLLTLPQVMLCLIGTVAIQSFAAFLSTLLFRHVGQSALARLRGETYARIMSLPMTFFAQRRVGELASRMSSDISQIDGALIGGLPHICRQIIVLIGTIALIAITSFELTVLLLLTLPFLVAAVLVFGRQIRRLSREMQDRLAACGVIVEESLQAIASVKAFANERYEVRRFSGANEAALKSGLRSAFWNGVFSGFTNFALFAGIIVVLWRGALLLQSGQLSAGELTRFVLYSTFLAGGMGQVTVLFGQIQRGLGATQRVQELLREPSEAQLQQPAAGVPEVLQPPKGTIEFSHVTFRYPTRPDAAVLSDISLVVPHGESLALVGPSGAGKSTIAALLLRFYDPENGSIRIGGRDIRDYPLELLRSQIAMVPQDVVLFGGSIAENIAYGKPGASLAEVREAARQANADVFIEPFPDGYDTTVGDRGVKLSGGQRQRIAIARAFLRNPSILILDEATSSLDSESELLIQRGLESLMRNRTTIIVAHRLATVRKADRIAVVEKGRIVEFGTHDSLLDREGGIYRRLSELQHQVSSPAALS